MKSVAWVGLVASVSAVALVAACGGAADTGLIGGNDDGGAASSGASGATSGSSGASGSSGSSGTSGSAGALPEGGTGPSAFTGAPAYTASTGRSTLKPGNHPNAGNPSKASCMSCHGPNGNGPPFFAAGSVFKDAAGTTPAPQVEIRLRDASGNAVSTYSDTLGNFFVTTSAAQNANMAFPVNIGARTSTATQLMSATAPNGDCNNTACHGGVQGWVHVP